MTRLLILWWLWRLMRQMPEVGAPKIIEVATWPYKGRPMDDEYVLLALRCYWRGEAAPR